MTALPADCDDASPTARRYEGFRRVTKREHSCSRPLPQSDLLAWILRRGVLARCSWLAFFGGYVIQHQEDLRPPGAAEEKNETTRKRLALAVRSFLS
jgi:hypothetical protein